MTNFERILFIYRHKVYVVGKLVLVLSFLYPLETIVEISPRQ